MAESTMPKKSWEAVMPSPSSIGQNSPTLRVPTPIQGGAVAGTKELRFRTLSKVEGWMPSSALIVTVQSGAMAAGSNSPTSRHRLVRARDIKMGATISNDDARIDIITIPQGVFPSP
jgi:hypothetical protein